MGTLRRRKGQWFGWIRKRLQHHSGCVDTQPTADPLRFGVAFSYTKSDTDYARCSADMDAYSLVGYGLWLGENGQFVDVAVVARMATAKTDMQR